jgi:oligopeptide transport system substrate-binding protein
MSLLLSQKPSSARLQIFIAALLLLVLTLVTPGCLSGGAGGRYYGRVVVPKDQRFRWSDGGLPQVFDPAFAAAPPDTDVVRALFEGLTDYDPLTLTPTPGVAERWESSDEGRVWTFYLRDDARWSTGEPVTATDFVRSWERTLRLGDLAPHTDLFSNIVGVRAYVGSLRAGQPPAIAAQPAVRGEARRTDARLAGVEEVSERVLRVRLQRPNTNFPALVAHPVFRPVKITNQNENSKVQATNLISNGAFLLTKTEADKVLLERAENYWGKAEVSLERVEFVSSNDTESALEAYLKGEVDALTNTPFEPLALKLLAPYEDYRRNIYAALTYYSFNVAHEPFNDVRVREALAIAIDRERLTKDEMEGASEPANTFLPENKAATTEAVVSKSASLNKDQTRARQLLAEAGFPDGEGFPVIKLLINRNEQQRIVAEAVAAAWRNVLGIETEVVAKPWDEYEASIRAGEYDLVRRGAVMQTADETSNIRMLFPFEGRVPASNLTAPPSNTPPTGSPAPRGSEDSAIETEADALRQLTSIPIYFASSYSLVKPYVKGFDSNVLDAPSLKTVKIETNFVAK